MLYLVLCDREYVCFLCWFVLEFFFVLECFNWERFSIINLVSCGNKNKIVVFVMEERVFFNILDIVNIKENDIKKERFKSLYLENLIVENGEEISENIWMMRWRFEMIWDWGLVRLELISFSVLLSENKYFKYSYYSYLYKRYYVICLIFVLLSIGKWKRFFYYKKICYYVMLI